jgi:hypothetical protein
MVGCVIHLGGVGGWLHADKMRRHMLYRERPQRCYLTDRLPCSASRVGGGRKGLGAPAVMSWDKPGNIKRPGELSATAGYELPGGGGGG